MTQKKNKKKHNFSILGKSSIGDGSVKFSGLTRHVTYHVHGEDSLEDSHYCISRFLSDCILGFRVFGPSERSTL